MEEAQKMEALKKAYADIILNTAKEAAARIMASERRAVRFQHELSDSKEEALNMLLRMKQTMDVQVADAETTFIGQKLKIEELEAQLNEAEDMVTDLRAELRAVQDELERSRKDLAKARAEQIAKAAAVSHEDASQVTKLSISGAVTPLDSEPGSLSIYDTMVTAALTQRMASINCCSVSENATPLTEPSDGLPTENYTVNPDITSIIMRSKEPELYRNGCTQRIRAFERNLLDGKGPLPEQTDIQYSNTMNKSAVKEDEIAELTHTVASPKDDNMSLEEKKQVGLERLSQQNGCSDNGQAVMSCRVPSRKRSSYRNPEATTDLVMQACETSALSHCTTNSCPGNEDAESDEAPLDTIKDELQKSSNSHSAPLSLLDKADVEPQCMDDTGSEIKLDKADVEPQCMDDTGSEIKVIKEASILNASDKDTSLTDELQLTRQNSEDADSSGFPICKSNPEKIEVQLENSDSNKEKKCKPATGPSTQAANARLLKYTFQRKRKREPLSCPAKNAAPEVDTKNIKSEEKQVSSQEPQKSNSTTEISRDSRRVVLGARQLISLSGGKRWQLNH